MSPQMSPGGAAPAGTAAAAAASGQVFAQFKRRQGSSLARNMAV